MKIMIVDDHRGMREMLKSLFDSADHQVLFCTDGSEAKAAYEEHRPEWVLMDIAMKELDGITATRQIKNSHPEARVVIVSEHVNPRLRQMATEAGACGFVPKDNLFAAYQIMNLSPPPDSLPGSSSANQNPPA